MMSCDTEHNESLAVVGMACRFPGAGSLDAFWTNLLTGHQSMRPAKEESLRNGPHKDTWQLPGYVRMCSCLEDVDLFDPEFFGYAAAEAEIMDPQHRLLLEVAWRAFENAGDTRSDGPEQRTGVYASVNVSSYMMGNLYTHMVNGTLDPFEVLLGNDKDYLATRIAYKLGLNGPAVGVQSACSSSMAALHVACQALVAGECDRALVGAATIPLPAELGYMYIPGGMRSPDGHCRPYDADAAGTIFGSGVAAVVLKRLEDAVEAKDRIWCVVRGSALNNDGREKVSFTAPNQTAQATVIREAMLMAGVGPEDMSFVEGHGTATPLGDPIEVAALRMAYDEYAAQYDQPVYLGSVKGNVGHLDATSGLAGFIKAALSLHHGIFPGTANFSRINPRFGDSIVPFEVCAESRSLAQNPQNRIGGVSSFGFGGTNVHMILQGVAEPGASREDFGQLPVSFALSADSEQDLHDLEQGLITCLGDDGSEYAPLRDVAFTLASGRRHGRLRRVVAGTERQDISKNLGDHEQFPIIATGPAREVCFLFPGQGAQSAHMLKSFYQQTPRFRELLEESRKHVLAANGPDILHLLSDSWNDEPGAFERISQTDMMQPVLFAIELGLATLFWENGIRPSCALGHSLGEISAACFAGVFSPSDAARLVTARGTLMQQAPKGKMLAALLPHDMLAQALGPLWGQVELVVTNSKTNCVVAGPDDVLAKVRDALMRAGGAGVFLRTSHAFHSTAMDCILDDFESVAATIPMSAPSIPVISNVTGGWAGDDIASPQYWVSHIRSCVQFDKGLEAAFSQPRMALEVGPGRVLSSLLLQHMSPDIFAYSPFAEGDECPTAGAIAEKLWHNGADILLHELVGDACRCPLPELPMRKRRLWITPEVPVSSAVSADSLRAEAQSHKSEDVCRMAQGCAPQRTAMPSVSDDRLEDVLAQIWKKVLRVSHVERHVSFIELGGNSVHVLHMIRLAQEQGIVFSLKDVFETKSIAELGRRICKVRNKSSAPEAVEADAETPTVDVDSRDLAVLQRLLGTKEA